MEASLKQKAALWFAGLNLHNIQVLYVYGTKLEAVYEAAIQWVRGDKYRSLVLLEDKLSSGHLNDLQVEWRSVSEQLSELDEIVLPYCLFSFSVNAFEVHDPQRFAEIKSLIAFFANYHGSAILGYSHGGVSFFNNYFNNILKLPDSYDGECLANKFNGIPAIICGAGPSLDKNIEVLRKLHSRALIFAGATAINALNAKGIVPHIGVGIDPNAVQLTRLIINQEHEMPFFYRNRINHKALDMIYGDKICFPGSLGFRIGNWLEKKLKLSLVDPPLPEGYNVLNFALSLAHSMGCNPIIVVGVDLAFSRGISYASGIQSYPLHDKETNFRAQSMEEEVLTKKDIYGHPIRTLWKWIRESLWYGLFAEAHPEVLLINATEGGIGFPGVQNKTLEEAAAQHLVQHYDMATRLHGEIQNAQWPQKVKKTHIIAILSDLLKSLKRSVKKYQCIEDKLSLAPEPPPALDGLLKEITQEDAFEAILQDIEESSFRFTSLERKRLNEKKMSRGELAVRQNTLDRAHYALLKKTAYSNALLLEAILKKCKVHQSNFPIKSKKPSTQPSEEGLYIFEGQCLTLRDPELDLNYSESFPSDSYLRKERLLYPEGSVKIEQFYQGMFLHGPSTFFSNKGEVLARAWFIHGQQQGKMHAHFLTGGVHSIQRFRDGHKHGKQEFFYGDGIPKMLLHYKEGRLHADAGPACTIYHPNGQLAREQYFINGQHEGVERMWDQTGELEIEVEYLHDKPINKARQWHSNGQLACEIIYGKDSRRISATYWNAEGNQVSKDEYEQEGYFEKWSKNAQELMFSLKNVISQVATIPKSLESNDPAENKTQPHFTEELTALNQEMSRLQELSRAIAEETAQESIEEYFHDPDNQATLKQHMLRQHQNMTEHMQSIDQGLKEMLTKLLKKNDDQHGK